MDISSSDAPSVVQTVGDNWLADDWRTVTGSQRRSSKRESWVEDTLTPP